ncbi:MAG: cytochrome C family protein [Nitrospirae bacterium]|nr:MAG: cytochrome C family protein [Nitrospirota bacterium]
MLNTFQKVKEMSFKMIKNFNRFNFCNFCIATFVTLVTIYTFVTSVVFAGIVGTKHDLSANAPLPTTIKATGASGVTQKCVFCHTPHSASKEASIAGSPLWNHSISSATYSVRFEASGFYGGDTWRVTLAKQPDGSSKLCLGCHDGTVALGQLVNVPGSGMAGNIPMTPQDYLPCGPLDYTCLGTNFVSGGKHLDIGWGDHLISMEYNSALAAAVFAKCPEVSMPIRDPGTISSTDPVKLYKTTHLYPPGEGNAMGVQCRSCHDPHNDPGGNNKFLVKGTPLNWNPLCETCHYTCP